MIRRPHLRTLIHSYENKNLLEIANVFAGLFSVIIIGLVAENFVFRNIEMKTVRKWGMQS